MTFRADEARKGLPPLAGEWVAREVPPAVAGWSDQQLVTLAAVVGAIVPGTDAARRAGAIAAALGATAPVPDVTALHALLDRLDGIHRGPFRGHLFVGRPAPEQLAALAAVRDGADPEARGALERIRRAVLIGAWSGPAPETAARLTAIGYQPDRSEVADTPEPARPLVVDAGADPLRLDADVVVVGSGAGGGVAAQRLAEAGFDVVVVEAAPWTPEAELPRREGAALGTLFLDRGSTLTADGAVAILAGATVGGGTTVGWTGCALPGAGLLAEWALHHGLDGIDGPETAADMVRLRGELGFLRPVVTPPRDRALFAGAAVLGWEVMPAARNTEACSACGSCGFGCAAGAKRAGVRLHLAAAASAGARLLASAVTERVIIDGVAATGVTGTMRTADGSPRPFSVRAPRVVVAAGALRTPLLLVRSGIRHPGLGTGLHLQPAALVLARMGGPVTAWSGPLAGARSARFSAPSGAAQPGPGPAHGGFSMATLPLHPGLLAAALPWDGPAGHDTRMTGAADLVPFAGTIRDRDPGRLVIAREGPPRVEHPIGSRDAATLTRARIELARLGRAAGARELLAAGEPRLRWSAEDGDAAFAAFLEGLAAMEPRGLLSTAQSGTAHAGADPRTAPCDPWGRVRRGPDGGLVRGLSVADASLAPSALGEDPAVSVMVLSARVARAVAAER